MTNTTTKIDQSPEPPVLPFKEGDFAQCLSRQRRVIELLPQIVGYRAQGFAWEVIQRSMEANGIPPIGRQSLKNIVSKYRKTLAVPVASGRSFGSARPRSGQL